MRGAPVEATGILRRDGYEYILDVGQGAFWTLDISRKARHHLGGRVHVVGKRAGFNRIAVEAFKPVLHGPQ